MKKAIALLGSSILLLSVVACTDAKRTTNVAPDSTQENVEVPNAQQATDSKADATSETRRRQLDADIQAREQRNNAVNQGSAENRPDKDVASEVRSKLEANIPAGALVIEANKGAVTVSGSVPTQQQFDKIAPLTQEIKGVKSVKVKVAVAPAKPANAN